MGSSEKLRIGKDFLGGSKSEQKEGIFWDRDNFSPLIRRLAPILFCAILALPCASWAQLDFTQWLNPGPLSQPHEGLEGVKNCTTCHATAKGVPDRKCLDCHKEISDRLAAKKGFHARQTEECRTCHDEHKGREFDVTGLSRTKFDHADTGWPLTGGHARVKCENCHKEVRTNVQTHQPTRRRTYLGANPECSACHEDVHKSGKPELEQCARCHTTDLWKKPKTRLQFDHQRESRYPLTGQHQRVACYGCHKQKKWAPLAFESCTNCHADPHKGSFGPKCESCHSTKGWKGASPTGKPAAQGEKGFDHDKTAFPLTGAHRDVTCLRCHGPKIGKMPGFEQCSGCHNNPHGNQFEVLWNVKKVCTDCHLTDGWNLLKFKHNDDSRYKLEGKHTLVPCQQCHVDAKYRWLPKAPDCVACHKDVHRGQFERTCASCHKTDGFNQLTFDHDRDSPFPLVGKHKLVACSSCHVEGRYKPLERRCQGCHNDFHKGELGQECNRCHAPTAYNDIEFDHNRESRFRLDGKHVRVPCNQCHVNYRYKIPKQECSACHYDAHKGTFGTTCERCHTTEGFSTKSGFHDFGEFTLGGAHDRIDCVVCHGPKAAVRARPTQCKSCHVDPHMGSLGPSCQNCHGQNFFLPSTFRHNQTGFELSGAHRFLSCDRCHFNRVFGGLPQECTFCHSKDFRPPPAVPQHPPAPISCDNCHFTFGWRPTR